MNETSKDPSRFGFAGAVGAWYAAAFRRAAERLRARFAPAASARALYAGSFVALYATTVLLVPQRSWWCLAAAPFVFLGAFALTAKLFVWLDARPELPFAPRADRFFPAPRLAAAAVFAVYIFELYRYGFIETPDTADQWEQIATGHFDDWHPVMHTMSIWLFAAIRRSRSFVLGCFIGVFSLLCGWLVASLRRYGYRRSVVWGALLLVTASPNSLFAARVLWKDSEFALALLYLGIAMLHLWHTKGRWLAKTLHWLPTAAVLVYASFVRHNGIFFTVPFLFFLPFLPRLGADRRKLAAFSLAVGVLLAGYVGGRSVLIRRGVLSGRCGDVAQKQSKQSFGEAVGMPMTMMGEAFVHAPERVPPEAARFLEKIAPREKWCLLYNGEFNSVKFATLPLSSTVFDGIAPSRFAKLFLATVAAAPGPCLRAFVRLTALGWDPLFRIPPYNFDAEAPFPGRLLYGLGLDRLWSAAGLYLLALVFAGAFAFIRRGAGVFFMVLPFAAYTLGTALLLSGWDHRFFWGVIVAAPPVIAALLRAPAAK